MRTSPLLAQGDIVLVSFPFTSLASTKVRPALLVGRPSGEDVIAAFITSRIAGGDGPAPDLAQYVLEPANAEFAATGLRAPSAIRLNKLATLHRGLIRRHLGYIGPATVSAVGACLRYVFDL